MLRTLSAIALALLLAGCGQSGPLYLPGNPSEVISAPPQQLPENEDQEDDGKQPDG